MGDPKEKSEDSNDGGLISGGIQRIIGEIETVGGALTGDPGAVAEGEFNQEVGEIREELEEEGVDDPNG